MSLEIPGVLWACEEGGWSVEGNDVGMWRREEETAKEEVDGGDNGVNRDGPEGAERSGEESKCVEEC